MARSEANRLHPQIEPTDLAMLTADCASMFRSAAESAGLRLVVQTPPDAPVVAVDRNMWTHIVLNLLSNAVKFTAAGSITITLAITGIGWNWRCADTGQGIAESDIPFIFERFHQLGTGADARREGAGIGLSLVADLVHAHEGTVQVTSTPGQGSTFTVVAPQGRRRHHIAAAAGPSSRRRRNLRGRRGPANAHPGSPQTRRPAAGRSAPGTPTPAGCCWSRTTPTCGRT